jgi:hypothetical protein
VAESVDPQSPRRERSGGVLAARVALVLACCTLSRSAHAYHSADEHLTDDTAWTLEGHKAWRLGLFKAAVGLGDRVTLGSYIWPWLGRTPNAYLKWRFYSSDTWNWAVQGGFFRLDTAAFDKHSENAAVFTVGSFSLLQSITITPHQQLSNGLVWTGVTVRGQVDQDTLRGAGEAGLTNLQYVGAYEYRLSQTTALVLTGRYLIAQVLAGRTRFSVHPDEFTTVDVVADARDDTIVRLKHSFSLVPSLAWSWQHFNLQIGLGYGNFNVPGVNFMVPKRTLVPDFDLYWTF